MIAILSDRTMVEVDATAKVGDLLWSTNGVEIRIVKLLPALERA
jgi:hypothetical protein